MRLRLLALAAPLLSSTAAFAASAPLSDVPSPDGVAIFQTDPFGSLDVGPSKFDATDPADKTKSLGLKDYCAGSSLSIYELSAVPPERIVLRDLAYESAAWGFFIDATDPALYDPLADVVTPTARSSVFRVATTGALAALLVQLSQAVSGTTLTQVFTLTNQGAATLTLRIASVADADIDVGPGFSQNWGFHDARFPGATSPAPSTFATITDVLEATGLTVRLEGGVPEGYRTLRASAPGWEQYRVPTFFGYGDPTYLNGLFTFPSNDFANGASKPFDTEIPDDIDADGKTDAAGDIALGLQTNLSLAAGATSTITLVYTLFSAGPHLVSPICPLPDTAVLTPLDLPLSTTSAFGKVTFSIAQGALPPGVTLTNGHLVGAPTSGGVATFTLEAKDEHGAIDTVPCSLSVVAFCGDGFVTEAGEACDDGNNTSGDGCSSSCLLETCGDGVLQTGLGEACDDGNTASGDGCTDACQIDLCNVSGAPIPACTATDVCHDAGACDPLTGFCSNPEKPAGAPCDDGEVCTSDACFAGQCVATSKLDGSPCAIGASEGQCFAGECLADPAGGASSGGSTASGSGSTGEGVTSSSATGSTGAGGASGASGAGVGGASNGADDVGVSGGACSMSPPKQGRGGASSLLAGIALLGILTRRRRS